MNEYDKECCYICSPYRGNVFERIRNRRYARYLTKKAIEMGYAPITPHLYITQVLNEKIPEERKRGVRGRIKAIKTMQAYSDWQKVWNKRGHESGNRGGKGSRKENNNVLGGRQ